MITSVKSDNDELPDKLVTELNSGFSVQYGTHLALLVNVINN